MRINVFIPQEMYLTRYDYIFVGNTCISGEDIFETDHIHLLSCENIDYDFVTQVHCIQFCLWIQQADEQDPLEDGLGSS